MLPLWIRERIEAEERAGRRRRLAIVVGVLVVMLIFIALPESCGLGHQS